MSLDRGQDPAPDDDLSQTPDSVNPDPVMPSAIRPRRKRRRTEPLKVSIEFVVVDGEAGKALARRQAAVMREVLRWLHEHPSAKPDGQASPPVKAARSTVRVKPRPGATSRPRTTPPTGQGAL
jgi:hypothetical protein